MSVRQKVIPRGKRFPTLACLPSAFSCSFFSFWSPLLTNTPSTTLKPSRTPWRKFSISLSRSFNSSIVSMPFPTSSRSFLSATSAILSAPESAWSSSQVASLSFNFSLRSAAMLKAIAPYSLAESYSESPLKLSSFLMQAWSQSGFRERSRPLR